MTPIELMQLSRLCSRLEIDTAEIDSSLTYWENKRHLSSLRFRPLSDRECEGEHERFRASLSRGPSRDPIQCPRCGVLGSGPHAKWVLNTRKVRYEPYYYMAHSVDRKVKWCYIPRDVADNLL